MSTNSKVEQAKDFNFSPDSPFHRGEQLLQHRLGVRDRMERFGRKVIRDHMPDQHREFYQQLPFVFVGHVDQQGWPWASILFGPPGFIQSPDDKRLVIDAQAVEGDPLRESLVHSRKQSLAVQLGFLGIELPTRRRNRLAAHTQEITDTGFAVKVDQAFGNCPQYIQTRELIYLEPEDLRPVEIASLSVLDDDAIDLISHTDTFFVASASQQPDGTSPAATPNASDGADVSHRGGRPGFIRIDSDASLTIPDYLGNNHFNTLGNFQQTPRAGLLFIDYERGHLLTLTGQVEILWDSPDAQHFEGAERLWQFQLESGRWLRNALPFRWQLGEFSPNSLLTGTWQEAAAVQKAETERNQWHRFKVVRIVEESRLITSFYLQPPVGLKPKFEPGQFLTIQAEIDGNQVVRTYTVSSAPADELLRISVKRQLSHAPDTPPGVMSNYLHANLQVGDHVQIKTPTGSFTLDPQATRPAVLISAGIGITPMLSMARHVLNEGVRTRNMRALTLISGARDLAERAFFDELSGIAEQSGGQIRAFWALSQPEPEARPGIDFHQQGRISKELLQAVLPLDDYDFFLCGPSGFMQSMYDMLRALGVDDKRIQTEAFGPSTLHREADQASTVAETIPAAREAIVEFKPQQVEQAWSDGEGTLLEFAEAHGLTPDFGCRSGQCGACKARLNKGKVAYVSDISAPLEEGEILLCCAVPAADVDAPEADADMPRISISF